MDQFLSSGFWSILLFERGNWNSENVRKAIESAANIQFGSKLNVRLPFSNKNWINFYPVDILLIHFVVWKRHLKMYFWSKFKSSPKIRGNFLDTTKISNLIHFRIENESIWVTLSFDLDYRTIFDGLAYCQSPCKTF